MNELPEYKEYKSKPYQRRGMSLPAKLLCAGGFLAFVAFFIGGENRPGPVMWAQEATQEDFGNNRAKSKPPEAAGTPTPASTIAASDSELDSWYGEVEIGQYDPNRPAPTEQQRPTAEAPQPVAPSGPPPRETAIPNEAITDIIN